MEEKKRKRTALVMSVSGAVVLLLLFSLPGLEAKAEAFRNRQQERKVMAEEMSALEIMQYYTANAEKEEEVDFPQQLRLTLPEHTQADDIIINNDYRNQMISLTIPGADADYLYDYPMVGKSTHIDNLTYEAEQREGVLTITLDHVYEGEQTAEEGYLYLDFLTPHQVYDKVVVIDAGHGGKDPGANRQGIYEKDIDLAIVCSLKELMDASGDAKLGVYYTRMDDTNPSLEDRVGLANEVEADLFISVHNNSVRPGQSTKTSGTAVLYDEEKAEEEPGSMRLAQICLDRLTEELDSSSKGLVKGNDIYIIKNAQMPVALVEVGFITNPTERDLLNNPEYQQKAAQAIYDAIYQALEEGF